VQACPLTGAGEFKTEDGGPMSSAPAFDCADAAVGELDADGLTFAFDVARFVRDGVLVVAIVPVESAPVVFAPPGDESLVVTGGAADVPPLSSPPASSGVRPRPAPAFEMPSPPAVTVAPAPPGPEVTPGGTPAPSVLASSARSPATEMGAGSAVIGSVLVVLLGALVAWRSRRALDRAVGSA
jgi:hypothetical protein